MQFKINRTMFQKAVEYIVCQRHTAVKKPLSATKIHFFPIKFNFLKFYWNSAKLARRITVRYSLACA